MIPLGDAPLLEDAVDVALILSGGPFGGRLDLSRWLKLAGNTPSVDINPAVFA